MNKTCVNIACGDSYLESWLNFDYAPCAASIKYANLLNRLPVADNSANVVYCSHFLEHIPHNLATQFLVECFRITRTGGRLRLVLPDWEELCNTYVSLRRGAQHDRADFLILEMLDQCVRRNPGGDLGAYYEHLQSAKNNMLIDFVRERTGHDLLPVANSTQRSNWVRFVNNSKKIRGKLEQFYTRVLVSMLPMAFRRQNISFTSVGEKHAWMYDFYSLERLLHQVGFIDVHRMSATTSNIPDFPFQPLDVTLDGQPRKGAESMYIEAVKP